FFLAVFGRRADYQMRATPERNAGIRDAATAIAAPVCIPQQATVIYCKENNHERIAGLCGIRSEHGAGQHDNPGRDASLANERLGSCAVRESRAGRPAGEFSSNEPQVSIRRWIGRGWARQL